MTRRTLFAVLLSLVLFGITQAQSAAPFYFGVDLSYVNEMDHCGAVYLENGEPADAFELFAAHGATLVRARLWHTPDWTAYSTLDDVMRTFTRARAAGMSTLLDIHYSDTWADPGRQDIPAAWADLDDDALVEAVYAYTADVLAQLAAADLAPDFVQIGNETNGGLLWRGGESDLARNARLFNAGIQAVRDFSAETGEHTGIVLHVAQPENTMGWFTAAEAAGVTDFDVIGISYYPQWSSFSIGDMGAQVTALRQRFGKEVMVVETGYGWTRENAGDTADNVLDQGLRGYPFSVEGQYQFMHDLSQALISNGALGVVYWEPAWVSTECQTRWGQGSHWENATFFDFTRGNELLPSINYLTDDYLRPQPPADGVIEDAYGAPVAEDAVGDVFAGVGALDLTALYASVSDGMLSFALTTAGDVFEREGSYLLYIDTTHDNTGAPIDVGRRPITAAAPFLPEFRLDIAIVPDANTSRASITLNAWTGSEWETVTFNGGLAVVPGEPSVIEIQIPLGALGNPTQMHVALVSTDRGRARGASDILGSSATPTDRDAALVLDQFFAVNINP